jgi:hypothetical protein
MATRSTIALEFADGTVGQVYCHWDGYLSHNGSLLLNFYSDPFKLQKLIDLGDVSTLAENVEIPAGIQHSFNAPDEDITVFYGRDRGEDEVEANYFSDFNDFVANGQAEEYDYILRTDGNWYVNDHGRGYKLLTADMVKE